MDIFSGDVIALFLPPLSVGINSQKEGFALLRVKSKLFQELYLIQRSKQLIEHYF